MRWVFEHGVAHPASELGRGAVLGHELIPVVGVEGVLILDAAIMAQELIERHIGKGWVESRIIGEEIAHARVPADEAAIHQPPGDGGRHPFRAGAEIDGVGDQQGSRIALAAEAGRALRHDVAFLDCQGRDARHMAVGADRFEVAADINLAPPGQSTGEPDGDDG